MAKSAYDLNFEFAERYKHLKFEDYRDTSMALEISKSILNLKAEHRLMKDVTGRALTIGDIVAHGNATYADVKIGVIVGFTPKAVRISHFNGYSKLVGLSGYGTLSTGSAFLIVNPEKKEYIEVD